MTIRALAWLLGLSQLLCWGVSFYAVGVLGDRMRLDLGWPASVVHGGFSGSLIVMGLVSHRVGAWIDAYGGRRVMTIGSVLLAAGCAMLALAREPLLFCAGWLVLGVAMRMTLYDAAFATLARIGGLQARGAMAEVTLLGGLASTVMWPLGDAIAKMYDWRVAMLVYALIALSTCALHAFIPDTQHVSHKPATHADHAPSPAPDWRIGWLYAALMAIAAVLNTALSAHMITLMEGVGVATATAVWVSTLRGVSQTTARFGEVLFGRRISAPALTLGAAALLPLCFICALYAGVSIWLALAFALLFGAGNGLLTIVRGTLPIVLFGSRDYGATVGRLLAPSFYLSALAPLAYALTLDAFGAVVALWMSLLMAVLALVAAAFLAQRAPQA